MSGHCCRDTSAKRCHGSGKGVAYAKSDKIYFEGKDQASFLG